jgi:RNA exonuclease 1
MSCCRLLISNSIFRWCKFSQWSRLTQIVCLAIDGIGIEDFAATSSGSTLKSIFPFQLDFISPLSYDSNLADDLSVLPLSAGQKEKLMKKYKGLQAAYAEGEVFKVYRSVFNIKKKEEEEKKADKAVDKTEDQSIKLQLLLSLSQMLDENYPLPLGGQMNKNFSHFVNSKDEYIEVNPDSPLFAVDCEMCITTAGKNELTKVCVVDNKLEVVYQSFVKPDNAITNYLTKFSGITPAMLEGVTTRLSDVQDELRRILPKDAIWVGQSLNFDLHALQIMHPYVIDTSVIFNISGERRRKTKLSHLSHMFLGEEIQCHGRKGHDPKEDAIAAM